MLVHQSSKKGDVMIKKIKAWLNKPEVKVKYKKHLIYAKSMEENQTLYTSTTPHNKKILCQTIEDMITTKKIKLNTISFGLSQRLSASLLGDERTATYRPSGIIFTTFDKPTYLIPFDLIVLTKNDHVKSNYYELNENPKDYYKGELISGCEKYGFKELKQLAENTKTPEQTREEVNSFRTKKGYAPIPEDKKRLFSYTECIFYQEPRIVVKGIYGESELAKKKAKELKVKHFNTAEDAYLDLTAVLGMYDRRMIQKIEQETGKPFSVGFRIH